MALAEVGEAVCAMILFAALFGVIYGVVWFVEALDV